MKYDEDYVSIGGDFITMTTQKHTGYLTAGTMEIKDDFYQYDDGTTYAFPASSSHKAVLSGTEKQSVTFESFDDSHFNYLELTQSEDMYVMSPDPCFIGTTTDTTTSTATTTTTTTTTATKTDTTTTATETTATETETTTTATETTTTKTETTTTHTETTTTATETTESTEATTRIVDISETETVEIAPDEQVQLVHSEADIITWISSDSSLVTIDKTGNVTIAGSGTAEVIAVDSSGEQYPVQIVIAEAETMLGDVNCDGTVNLDDATMVLTIYASIAAGLPMDSYTEAEIAAADVDGNGMAGLSDATAVLSYYAQNAAGLDPSWDEILAV